MEIRLWEGGHLRAAAARFCGGNQRKGAGLEISWTTSVVEVDIATFDVHSRRNIRAFFKSAGGIHLRWDVEVSRPQSDSVPPSARI